VAKLTIQKEANGQVSLQGDLTFDTIGKQLPALLALLPSANPLVIDLAQVTAADSAALALLVEWKKMARQHKSRISLTHVPEQLTLLAILTGFDLAQQFAPPQAPIAVK
jgi:phospholipid transport system transporter-binding protein